MAEGRIERALIVEDEPAWQELVSEILAECGLEVDVTGTVEEAIILASRASHRLAVVDLALGDGLAANREGLGVLSALRRQDPGCVTILLTGYATVELAVRAVTEYGAVSCLEKAAFTRSEFRSLVRRALSVAPPSDTPLQAGATRSARLQPRSPGDGAPNDAYLGEGAQGTTPTVMALVVDDDAGWRSILAELLSEAGYRVRLCNGYGEAVGCLRRESYALAVVDLSLCEALWATRDSASALDGYQLLALTHNSGIPTIVVSGVADVGDIERAYGEFAVFAYLEKQAFDRRAFLETLTELRTAGAAPRDVEGLTSRELEVLALVALGKTNKEIADALIISPHTVKRHLGAIFGKLDVHTRAAATAKAITLGIQAGAPSRDVSDDGVSG